MLISLVSTRQCYVGEVHTNLEFFEARGIPLEKSIFWILSLRPPDVTAMQCTFYAVLPSNQLPKQETLTNSLPSDSKFSKVVAIMRPTWPRAFPWHTGGGREAKMGILQGSQAMVTHAKMESKSVNLKCSLQHSNMYLQRLQVPIPSLNVV